LTRNEDRPATVPKLAKQAGETRPRDWDWVERSVWTDRMLEALERGVKGGVWFSLVDKVYRPDTLRTAWEKVKTKQGAAGSDGQTIAMFEQRLERNLTQLEEELRSGTYRPRPIRRVYIDKPGSAEKRPLGIPAVRDRVVQSALRIVIEPIFEAVFTRNSYGFRQGRGCKDALREVERLLKEGHVFVLDADLRSYFESIPHEPLLGEVRKHIADGRVLELIEQYLKQDILDGLAQWTPESGTPQGAVISPLLANLYLHSVDVTAEAAGLKMIRYADDFVILCRSREEAESALEMIRDEAEAKGLTLHPDKTRIADVRVKGEGFDFLGYHFERGTRWPRKKSLKKFKDNVRSRTKRCNGQSMEQIILDLNEVLRGWYGYFKHGNKWTFLRLDAWIRMRLRSILRKRNGMCGKGRGSDHQRWPNKYFRDRGLFSLAEAHASYLQSS